MSHVKTKACFKCGADKALTEFYRHPMMADGHVNKCKECNKKDVRGNRASKVDYYRSYDKRRYQEDPRVKERRAFYEATPEGKEAARRAKKAWAQRNPVKRAAHIILSNALKGGLLVKPSQCQRCGVRPVSRHLHGHHRDYNFPLDVEWICLWCHIDEHKE